MPHFADNLTARLKMLGWLLHGAGLITLLAAGYAVFCLAHLPLAKKSKACADRISVVDGLLDNSEEIRTAHSRFKDSLAKMRRRTDTLRQRIPDRPCETEFLEQMNEAANKEGLEIRDYRRGAVTVVDTHSQLEVHVQCVGSYPETCRFLDRLAKLPRLSTVEKVTISSDSAVEAYPVDLTLRLYFGVKKKPDNKRKARNG